jgi:hypothetical protein
MLTAGRPNKRAHTKWWRHEKIGMVLWAMTRARIT